MGTHVSGYNSRVQIDFEGPGGAETIVGTTDWDLTYEKRMLRVPVMGSALRSTPVVARVVGLADYVFTLSMLIQSDIDVTHLTAGANLSWDAYLVGTSGRNFSSTGLVRSIRVVSGLLDGIRAQMRIEADGVALTFAAS